MVPLCQVFFPERYTLAHLIYVQSLFVGSLIHTPVSCFPNTDNYISLSLLPACMSDQFRLVLNGYVDNTVARRLVFLTRCLVLIYLLSFLFISLAFVFFCLVPSTTALLSRYMMCRSNISTSNLLFTSKFGCAP